MGWDVLLFDLDGTLTDSGPGIMHAAETALGSFGITGLSEQALRQFVGPPLVESFAVYLPQADVETAIDRFRAYYRETGWLENEPYPGVRECLHALQAAGKRMYVATSKLESMARQVLTHFDLMRYFDGVCGGIADDPEAGKKANVVRRALREAGCQIVIASFHWGSEYRDDFTGEQRTIGRAAIKAGADIVVGTHPHIVQGIEAYQDSYILYSLGNLVFGGNVDPDDRDAYLARVTFTVYEDHCDAPELTVVPIRLTALDKGTDYRPVVADDADSARNFKRTMKLSSGMGDFVNGELTEGL